MFRRKVTGPDGRRWTLGRRWLPRRKKFKKADLTDFGPDLPGVDGLDDLGIVGAIIAAVLIVFARTKELEHEWPVVGYLNGRRRIQEIAGQLALGTQLDPAPRDG